MRKRTPFVKALIASAAFALPTAVFAMPAQESELKTRVVVDAFDRSVEVPAVVRSIAAVGGAARTLTYAGYADMIVGVTEMDKKATPAMPYSLVNAARFASLPSVGSGGSNDTPFIEQLIELSPDIIVAHTALENVLIIAEKTGIPTIGIYPEGVFDPSFPRALRVLEEAVGPGGRASEVSAFVDVCARDLEKRTKDIPENQKPSVYAGGVSFRGGHGFEGTYGAYPPFDAVHAKNVADAAGKKGGFLIDPEKVLAWDPDIIFLNPANMHLVNEDYAKRKDFYESFTAVKKGRIYAQVSYNYNWTNMEIAIADAYYAGKVIYPERFSDVDMDAKADEIFSAMLGEPLYAKLKAEGMAFGPMTIGK